MNRRDFVVAVVALLALGVAAAPLAAEAQQAGKIPRIGVLALSQAPPVDSFFQSLRDLGWSEGRNIVIERRYAEGRVDRLPALAAELVRLKVDVIVAAGGPAGLDAARDATKTIPIVMVGASSDPIADGLIESYARPGGNITGIANSPEEVPAKRLELLKEAVPKLSRVGVLWDATIGPVRISKATEETSRSLRVAILAFEVRGPADLDRAISAAAEAPVGGMIIASTPMLSQNREQIVELVTKHRLPAISLSRSWPEEGLLMSYGSNLADLFRRAALYVDKILKGAKPADLPVERPSGLELIINLKTAKTLGITIPQSLLLRADEAIQ
jgi:putative ABC transport system substrate-binding protein